MDPGVASIWVAGISSASLIAIAVINAWRDVTLARRRQHDRAQSKGADPDED